MAEFKIDGRMTVRTLKDSFKNEFEGTLRVYNGREKADDNATLASIRKVDDVKRGEYICRASRTVGKFEKEMMEVFGIKVQVASPDDWVLALDGITLANLKNIKKNATKVDMEELVAYKRKKGSKDNDGFDANEEIDESHKGMPIFDFQFEKVDWELNEENIEKHREELSTFGVIYIRAFETDEDSDFETKVFVSEDIAEDLYAAMEEVERFTNLEYETVQVFYTTKCEFYGEGKAEQHMQDIGYVISEYLGYTKHWFGYELEVPAVCRASWDECTETWTTDEYGNWADGLDLDVDLLIANKTYEVAEELEYENGCIKLKSLSKEAAIFISYRREDNGELYCSLESIIAYGQMYDMACCNYKNGLPNYEDYYEKVFDFDDEDMEDLRQTHWDRLKNEYDDTDSMVTQIVEKYNSSSCNPKANSDGYTVTIFIKDTKVFEKTITIA